MAYRVIQWGTGAVGTHTLRAVLDHPQLELVGLKACSEAKLGRDAGELVHRPATGIRAVRAMADLRLAGADCVLYVPMQPDYDEIAALLRAGVSVITTAGNMYPQTYGNEVTDKPQAACRSFRVRDSSLAFEATGAFSSNRRPRPGSVQCASLKLRGTTRFA